MFKTFIPVAELRWVQRTITPFLYLLGWCWLLITSRGDDARNNPNSHAITVLYDNADQITSETIL